MVLDGGGYISAMKVSSLFLAPLPDNLGLGLLACGAAATHARAPAPGISHFRFVKGRRRRRGEERRPRRDMHEQEQTIASPELDNAGQGSSEMFRGAYRDDRGSGHHDGEGRSRRRAAGRRPTMR